MAEFVCRFPRKRMGNVVIEAKDIFEAEEKAEELYGSLAVCESMQEYCVDKPYYRLCMKYAKGRLDIIIAKYNDDVVVSVMRNGKFVVGNDFEKGKMVRRIHELLAPLTQEIDELLSEVMSSG